MLSCLTAAQDDLTLGFLALQNRQYKDAQNHFEKVLQTNPGYLDAGLGLAQAFIGQNDFENAEKILQDFENTWPDNPRIKLGLGQVLLARGSYAKAVEKFEYARQRLKKNKTIDASLALAYYNLGVIAYQNGNRQNAAANFYKSIDLNPANIYAFRNLAVTLSDLGRSDEAEKIVQRGLALDENNRALLLIAAKLALADKKFGQVVDALTSVWESDPSDIEIGLKLAYFLRYQNKGDKAEEIYRTLSKYYPGDIRITNEWVSHLKSRKDYQGARELYTTFMQKNGPDAEVYHKLAEIHISQDSLAAARRDYQKALELFPCHIATLQKSAESWEKQGNWSQARNEYLRALQCCTGSSDSLDLLPALAVVYEKIDTAGAISAYRTILKLSPDVDSPHVRLGEIYLARHDTVSAEKAFQRAAFLFSPDPLPYMRLAEFHLDRKDSSRAREFCRSAIRRGLQQRNDARSKIIGELETADGQMTTDNFKSINSISQATEASLPVLRDALELALRLTPDWQREEVLREFWEDYQHDTVLPEYLGRILETEKSWDEAESVYRVLLQNNVRSAEAHRGLARIFEKQGDVNQALMEYKRVIEIDNHDSTSYRALFGLYESGGKLDELYEDWQLKYRVDNRNVTFLEYFAELLDKLNKNDQAVKVRERIDRIRVEEEAGF
ncbi:tetratricopeptide repeat protein [candidate division KSB1 bacterium]|nr:tetratricopeptide repeat protein [candidate division KSB1 bacterium]